VRLCNATRPPVGDHSRPTSGSGDSDRLHLAPAETRNPLGKGFDAHSFLLVQGNDFDPPIANRFIDPADLRESVRGLGEKHLTANPIADSGRLVDAEDIKRIELCQVDERARVDDYPI